MLALGSAPSSPNKKRSWRCTPWVHITVSLTLLFIQRCPACFALLSFGLSLSHEWRVVKNPDETTTKVDKDVIVFQKRFGLETSWDDLSPIVIDRGMTRRYLDGEIDSAAQLLKVEEAYARISQAHDFVVVEGTGHAGVGSIIDMNNAQVAAALGLDAVLVVGGGLGSSFDEFAANKAICDAHGVRRQLSTSYFLTLRLYSVYCTSLLNCSDLLTH